MPYVEYSVDQDDKLPQSSSLSKNVARKSSVSKLNHQNDNACEKPVDRFRFNEKKEINTKGYIRTMALPRRICGQIFVPHQCGPSCVDWTNFSPAVCKNISPLAIPLLYGYERF